MLNPIKTTAIAIAASGMAMTAAPASAAEIVPAPVQATHAPAYGDLTFEHKRHKHRRHHHGYYDRGHYDRGYYGDPVYRDTRVWRGRDGRYYCRKKNGTTGLLIGGAAGALLGREIAGRNGDRTLGAILGAAGGAILGRSIDRGNSRCR